MSSSPPAWICTMGMVEPHDRRVVRYGQKSDRGDQPQTALARKAMEERSGCSLYLPRMYRGSKSITFKILLDDTAAPIVFVRFRVPLTIVSSFDHSLQFRQIFISCALFVASIDGVCLLLHINVLLRNINGLSGELSQKAYVVSRMMYFGTETIHYLFYVPLFTLKVRLNLQPHQYIVDSNT